MLAKDKGWWCMSGGKSVLDAGKGQVLVVGSRYWMLAKDKGWLYMSGGKFVLYAGKGQVLVVYEWWEVRTGC